MTIVYSDSLTDPPTFGWDLSGGRTYSATVRAITDSNKIGPTTLRADMWDRLLGRRDHYRWPLTTKNGPPTEYDWGVKILGVNIEAEKFGKGRAYWKIGLRWGIQEPREFGMDPNTGLVNPMLAPPEVVFDDEDIKRSWPYDADNKPYVNAAGETLQDPPQVDDAYPTLTIVRNEATFDFTLPGTFKNQCNLGTWVFWPDNTVRVKKISPARQYSPDFGVYWTVTYQFQIRPETWIDKVLNAGTKYKSGGALKQIVIDGATISDPVPLNADGTWAPSGVTPNFLSFRNYGKLDFSPLGIDESVFRSGFIY